MEFTAIHALYAVVIAIVSGLLATWLGVGGCFLRIPLIMLFFGVPIKTAYCINQAVVALATLPGVYEHFRSKHVYTKGLVVAALAATAGVGLGAYVVAKYIPAQVLRIIFGFACVAIGIYIAKTTLKKRRALTKRITVAEVRELEHGKRLAILMFLAGFATGLCGFGGGIYFVPIYMWLAYPTHVAIGTSSAQMIPVASLGSSILTALGYMDPRLFVAIAIPTMFASWFGARLAKRSSPWLLRMLYSLSIIGAGMYVAISGILALAHG